MGSKVASRGLVFVFERSDQKMKDELVRNLTETLTAGKKGFKLTSDTTLFQGVIQKANLSVTKKTIVFQY